MARPTKQGIDYFPLDVQFDDKVELYIAETGAIGLSVLVTIWQLIYQNNGYYISNNSDLVLLVRRRLMADISDIESCISSAIGRGVFDQSLERDYKILTSKAIQKRYFDAAKKKKFINVVENFVLEGVSAGDNAVYSVENPLNVDVDEKEDVKVKEKEEEKVEVKEPLPPATESAPPKKKAAKKAPSVDTKPTWEAYISAYTFRYGCEPLRNAQVNGQMSRFCKSVPLEDAPSIAAFYVSHNDGFYVKQSHPVGLLLKDAQKLNTERIRGIQITTGSARQIENTQTNASAVQQAIAMSREAGKS